MSEYQSAKPNIKVSPGESVRILRELQELSQNELADLTRIPESTLSAIEDDQLELDVERAKIIARVLKCHPAVLVFPGWDVNAKSVA
ncbi:MAG: helix-turn-helix domain-containing protein [Cyanobacteria bacterium]|jgi:transcriptional regulator with XRE-family HTH domain|nr:helix-turn-helix domain-containing protein [Cyanobacteria bacterium GSL.Bin1]